MAPFTPFFTEVLYQNLRKVSSGVEESIHYCSFPQEEGKVLFINVVLVMACRFLFRLEFRWNLSKSPCLFCYVFCYPKFFLCYFREGNELNKVLVGWWPLLILPGIFVSVTTNLWKHHSSNFYGSSHTAFSAFMLFFLFFVNYFLLIILRHLQGDGCSSSWCGISWWYSWQTKRGLSHNIPRFRVGQDGLYFIKCAEIKVTICLLFLTVFQLSVVVLVHEVILPMVLFLSSYLAYLGCELIIMLSGLSSFDSKLIICSPMYAWCKIISLVLVFYFYAILSMDAGFFLLTNPGCYCIPNSLCNCSVTLIHWKILRDPSFFRVLSQFDSVLWNWFGWNYLMSL